MDQAQLAQKRICVDFLVNDELLHNQLGLFYRYPSQILYSNLDQLRFIVLAITDRV